MQKFLSGILRASEILLLAFETRVSIIRGHGKQAEPCFVVCVCIDAVGTTAYIVQVLQNKKQVSDSRVARNGRKGQEH